MPKIDCKQRRDKEFKQLITTHVSRAQDRSVLNEIEGTRVPDTDQSWGPGEVLQLGQTAMTFGRQVDNIIWK